MTDTPKSAPEDFTPESEATERVKTLEQKASSLEAEIKTLEGRLANRNPALLAQIRAENGLLEKKFEKMQKALFMLIHEKQARGSAEEHKIRAEVLRSAAIEFFKKTNIDAELWKNLVS